jgi:hypothetical protein
MVGLLSITNQGCIGSAPAHGGQGARQSTFGPAHCRYGLLY